MLLNKATNPLADCQLKFDNGKEGVFEGYASVWGRVDSYGDTVVKGAFEKTIAQHKDMQRMPLMLFGHSPGRVIGKWQVMTEDDYGLRVVGELTPGHTDAENIKASMFHGAISGLSIGFRLPPNGSEEKGDGPEEEGPSAPGGVRDHSGRYLEDDLAHGEECVGAERRGVAEAGIEQEQRVDAPDERLGKGRQQREQEIGALD